MAFWGEEQKRAGERRGLGGLAAEPDPRPETPVTQSRVPWREVGRIPETPPGVPTGFGLAVSGGSLPKLAIDSGDRGRAVQLAINHLVARPSEEVQAGGSIFRARSEHAPPIRGTGTQGATYSVASGQRKKWTLLWCNTDVGGPGVVSNPGPFPRVLFGPSSAREHQHEDEAGGDNRGLQIQRQREVGGGTEEREEGGHYDPPIVAGASSSLARRRRQLSKRVTLGSGNYSDNESAWGPTQSTAVRSTLNWHPPHPETGPGDAHE